MATGSSFVQVPLIRMVDLAISSPDGSVNFHLLQAVLHALITKTNAQQLAVEIHGAEALKLQEQLKVIPDKATFTIKETIDKSVQGKDQQVYVMQADTSYQGPSSVAKEKIDNLEAEINDLKKQIQDIRDLPGNLGIIDAVKNSDDKTSSVLDVFHMLALQKRIEAAEEGMVKVATIVEDLIKSPAGLSLETKNVVCQKDEIQDSVNDTDSKRKMSRSSVRRSKSSKTVIDPDFVTNLKQLPIDEQVLALINEVSHLKMSCDHGKIHKEIDDIQSRLKMKKHKSYDSITGSASAGGGATEDDIASMPPDTEVGLMEEKFKDIADHLDRLNLTFNEEITRLHNQYTDIERDFNDMLNRLEVGFAGGDTDEPNACCSAVHQKLIQLQNDFIAIQEASAKMQEDKHDKEKMLEIMMEQIEVLKTVKADREDIEEALADKADACAVMRKVSHDQLDNACEELSRSIEEALEKLSQQEFLWQQALDDIQSEIGNKLDKMDLGPLREFINNKLRMLQDKMKSLAALKREQEAAGSKNKLLRDVNCISCNKEVVMKKEFDLSFRPAAPAVPPTKSMAPYLAYELDVLRKQQKGMPGSKNLHSFEAALQGKLQKKADDHICNRYCGGSHTITTPQQRVTRLGHFLMQWGPEAQPSVYNDPKIKRPSGVGQQLNTNLPQEVTTTPAKISSKVDQSKRVSKSTQPRVSKQPADDENVKRESSVSSKRKVSVVIVEKKGSPSSKSSIKGKEGGVRPSKTATVPETIPEENVKSVEEIVVGGNEGKDTKPSTPPPAEGEAAPEEAAAASDHEEVD